MTKHLVGRSYFRGGVFKKGEFWWGRRVPFAPRMAALGFNSSPPPPCGRKGPTPSRGGWLIQHKGGGTYFITPSALWVAGPHPLWGWMATSSPRPPNGRRGSTSSPRPPNRWRGPPRRGWMLQLSRRLTDRVSTALCHFPAVLWTGDSTGLL